ncbi:hypothetical protein M3P21_21870 [Ruegeria sp. 2012CJ41-6]|uniref:Uncharacterized protein n=1 Tax=Ruegeria spongiae TaxID=2942209 RepID=A0ABT0QAG3_9RHOB|nr:hypothetical protein [Ruegeria spongiae]MCL6286153.1 hypothetical protein [Ruegeria spongiae]
MAIATASTNPYVERAQGQLLAEGRHILHMHFDYLAASATVHFPSPDHCDTIDAIRARGVLSDDKLGHNHTRHFRDRFVRFMRVTHSEDSDFDLSTREKAINTDT